MRTHPKWLDGEYWRRIRKRAAVIAERDAENVRAAARKQQAISQDVERFLARQRGEETQA